MPIPPQSSVACCGDFGNLKNPKIGKMTLTGVVETISFNARARREG
uniref:Uncharacterized protein n=1 Tax=Rhizophora mucronata TaxID=61149 RepID=A0A2P2P663_RHIMU